MGPGDVVKGYIVWLLTGTVIMLLCDAWLWASGRQTVSDWLRQHRTWYDYAVATAAFLNALLFIHLYRGGNPPR